MKYRYPRHRIEEIVRAPKCPSQGHSLQPRQNKGGSAFDVQLDLLDGPFSDLRFLGRAGRTQQPETYETSFLLDQQRVRGIGYNTVGRQNFRAKLRIPAGWHQNICDPNVPTDHPEWNRHEPLPDFAPADFAGFIRSAAKLWNIDPGWETELL